MGRGLKVVFYGGELCPQYSDDLKDYLKEVYHFNLPMMSKKITERELKEYGRSLTSEQSESIEQNIQKWLHRELRLWNKAIRQNVAEALKRAHQKKCEMKVQVYDFVNNPDTNMLHDFL